MLAIHRRYGLVTKAKATQLSKELANKGLPAMLVRWQSITSTPVFANQWSAPNLESISSIAPMQPGALVSLLCARNKDESTLEEI